MEELTRIRNELGWTQQKLSDESGVNKATINQIERGKRSPNVETLAKLAHALGVGVADFFPKAQAPLFRGLPEPEAPGERRKSKLPEVADLLLGLGHQLLLMWEAELPERARTDDEEWLANIVVAWRAFGLINYGVLEELGADGLNDKEAWLARYMDINAAIHRINAAIADHSAAGASPDEAAATKLEPLASA